MMMLTVLVVLSVAFAAQAKQHTGSIRGGASDIDDDLRKLVGVQMTQDVVLDDGSPMKLCQDSPVKLERTVGSTPFSVESIEVVSVASTEPRTVTVDLKQSWTDGTLDSIFAYYHTSAFDRKCYEHTDVSEGIFDTITITCATINPVALLEICVADSFSKEVLVPSDAATIPQCCYPELSPETGSVCYVVVISCEPCETKKTPEPTKEPTAAPTEAPTEAPSTSPTTPSPTPLPTSPPSKSPTSSPTKNPTVSPTMNPTPAPTICDHEITCPDTDELRTVSSTSWRLWATPKQLDDGKQWDGQHVWDVKEIKFYSDVNCRSQISHSAGNAFNSKFQPCCNDKYAPRNAFQSSNFWGGRPDPYTGNLWIGMNFPTPKTVKCVSVKNEADNFATQFWVQALNMDTNEWEDVWNGRNLSQERGATNNRALNVNVITLHPWNRCKDTYSCQNGAFVEDYGIQPCPEGELFEVEVGECRNENTVDYCPLDCDTPTAAPTNEPTAAPTNNPTASPTKNPTLSPTKNPTLSPTNNPTPSPTNNPTPSPTKNPTASPTKNPTPSPTNKPTPSPTNNPTPSPTNKPTPSPTKNPTPSPTKNPTPSPTNKPTPSPTKNPTPAPTICDHEITCPETPPQVSSTSWRLFATPRQLDDGKKWQGQSVWDLKEIQFYSNVGCTAEITRNGTPFNSAYYDTPSQEYVPQKAFQNNGLWGGRPDPDTGNLWIGMTFSTPKTVKCVKVRNSNNNHATQFWVQALNTGTNEWEDVWNGRDLSQGNNAWNTRALDADVITLHPWNKCKDTYSCQNGSFVEDYGIQPCPVGRLFDVEVGECRAENTVPFCPLDCIPPTPSPTNNPTPPPTREPTPCPTTARADCSNFPWSRAGAWVWDGCKVGFFCSGRDGQVLGDAYIECPQGQLFDIRRSDCYPADTVDCPVC